MEALFFPVKLKQYHSFSPMTPVDLSGSILQLVLCTPLLTPASLIYRGNLMFIAAVDFFIFNAYWYKCIISYDYHKTLLLVLYLAGEIPTMLLNILIKFE